MLRHLFVCVAAWSVVASTSAAQVSGPLPALPQTVVAWLDAYVAGRHDQVASELQRTTDFKDILEQLTRDGPGWIAATGPAGVDRRELVAVTLALEATRAAIGQPWKVLLKAPSDGFTQIPGFTLYWEPPPLILEWACARLRARTEMHPAERWWQLAAVAVGHRSEDFQFLVGEPFASVLILNKQDEIEHLLHAEKRFPEEMRIQLAKAIAIEWRWPREAMAAFLELSAHPSVGAEARVRLGVSQARGKRYLEAVETLRRAERETREPHLVYLARLFRGQALEALERPKEAELAYRSATLTIPGAQAAATALGGLLAADGRRLEAQDLIRKTLAVRPMPADPWRVYVHGDDRYWPYLVDRLRKEISK